MSPETVDITHAVSIANEITSLTTDAGSTPQTEAFIHDRAGNVVFDGRLFYQYDGFNRLAAVYLAADGQTTWLTVADFDADGRLEPTATPGPLLVAFDYDAVGRLLRTTRYDRVGNTQVEAYAYDGVRRIQETETTYPPVPAEPTTAVREYVWGPDYVDELVAQLDWGTTWGTGGPPAGVYGCLLDGSYNVVALVGDLRQPPPGTDLVRVQYTYEPYGGVVLRDEAPSGPLPINSIGHQGLFFYRLDGPADADPLAPGAVGLYHNRNRWYNHDWGRFLSPDPNGTALPSITGLAMAGQAWDAALAAISAGQHYADGLNTFTRAKSNPLTKLDPAGLIANHLYPLYLGGASNGPGFALDGAAHDAFHASIHAQLNVPGYGEQARYRWESLTDPERKVVLAKAAAAAGVDVSDPEFIAKLDRSFVDATPGIKNPHRGRPTLFNVKKVPRGAAQRVTANVPGANAAQSIGKALVIIGAVNYGMGMAEALNINNPFLRDMAVTTVKSRQGGNISILDEVFVYYDMYMLTQDPVSAAWGWMEWGRQIGLHD